MQVYRCSVKKHGVRVALKTSYTRTMIKRIPFAELFQCNKFSFFQYDLLFSGTSVKSITLIECVPFYLNIDSISL